MRPHAKVLTAALITASAGLLLTAPVVTRQGINYQVTEKKIPLVFKGASFFMRDHQYRRLAASITRQAQSPEERALALLHWTHDKIQRSPKGLPVIDDHVASIITRGYGEEDQIADVFTTLAVYSGIPAFWKSVRTPGQAGGLVLSFLKIEDRWTVWDAAAGIPFRNGQGGLADMDSLRNDPSLLPTLYRAHGPAVLEHFSVPEVLRPTKQMPVPRLMIELRQRIRGRNSA